MHGSASETEIALRTAPSPHQGTLVRTPQDSEKEIIYYCWKEWPSEGLEQRPNGCHIGSLDQFQVLDYQGLEREIFIIPPKIKDHDSSITTRKKHLF